MLIAEARAKIAAAQKRRWAKQKERSERLVRSEIAETDRRAGVTSQSLSVWPSACVALRRFLRGHPRSACVAWE